MAGIKVLSDEEYVKVPGGPYLYVSVGILGPSPYVYNVSIGMRQVTTLLRNSSGPIYATTWDVGSLGLTSNLMKIRSVVKDNMDKFINAWLSVNPK